MGGIKVSFPEGPDIILLDMQSCTMKQGQNQLY